MHGAHAVGFAPSASARSPRPWVARSIALVAIACLLAACVERTQEIPALDPEAATDLVRSEFPDAGVVVSAVEVSGTEATGTTDFTLGDTVVAPVFGYEEGWQLTHVELDGERFTVFDLRAMVVTRDALVTLYDGLARYHADRGEYPEGIDASGLEALVPDYVPDGITFADGWGHPFAYRPQQGEFSLSSSGLDGEPGTPDDLILLSTGG